MAQDLINADLWLQHVKEKLSPEQQHAMDRIVLAGMKVMFSKETHQMMLNELDGDGDIVQKLAQGISKLMLLLFKQSKQSIPQELIIPAAGVLLAKACEFLIKSGEQIDENIFHDAMGEMTRTLMREAGATDEQLAQMQGGQSQQQSAAPAGMLKGA